MKWTKVTAGLVLSLVLGSGIAVADPAAARDFEAANDRALKGDWDQAAGLYQSLIDRGIGHADVYYNLGNAQMGRERPVEAIIAYERALRVDPGHEDARANLGTVRAALGRATKNPGDRLEEQDVAFVDVAARLVSPLPRVPFAWAVVLSQGLLFLGWWLARRARSPRSRRGFAALAWLGGLALLASGGVTLGHWLVYRDPVAVARVAVPMQQGPDARFEKAGPVARGARLRILETDGEWVRVLQANGTSGWVPATQISRL